MIRTLATFSLAASALAAGDSSPTTYFGPEATRYLSAFVESLGGTPGFGAELAWVATNDYPTLFAFAGEPSLAPIPGATGTIFRYAQAGTWVNPGCDIFRISFEGASAKIFVATGSYHWQTKGFTHFRRGERDLDSQECVTFRALLAQWDTAAPPSDAGRIYGDVAPALFEFTDGTRHTVVPRYVDRDAWDVFAELHRFCYKLLRGIQLQPVAPHEPPPRASVSTVPEDRTLDSLPAPVSGGGR